MEVKSKKATVVLVAFYNIKALGVRYLETALQYSGYRVVTIFLKILTAYILSLQMIWKPDYSPK